MKSPTRGDQVGTTSPRRVARHTLLSWTWALTRQLSFSAAIIDDHGDGLVISSIHTRGESRSYAKGVVGGISEVTLTPEEQQALAAARTGKGAA